MKHYVYKTTNIKNGKYYIGKHSSENIKNDPYLGSGKHLCRAIKKYGRQNFVRQILYQFDQQELSYIKQHELLTERIINQDKNCYNLQIGGRGGLTGMVCVYDSQGKKIKVTKEKFLTGEYISIHKGKVAVQDRNNIHRKVLIKDFLNNNGKYKALSRGRIIVRNKETGQTGVVNKSQFDESKYELFHKNMVVLNINGKNKLVSKDSELYKCGNYISPNKGKSLYIDENNKKYYITKKQAIEKNLISIAKNTFVGMDKNNNFMRVNKDDPRYLSGQIVGATIGKVVVKDKTGAIFQIDKNDPRYLSGQLVHNTTGMVVVKDSRGNTFQVDKNNEQYLSGNLVGITKGKFLAKDSNGNRLFISITDDRYLNGTLVGIAKNKVVVKDKSDNIFQIDKQDIKYKTKQFVGVNYNKVFVYDTVNNKKCVITKKQFLKNKDRYRFHTKGMVSAKTKQGKNIQISINDPRYLSGQIVGINTGTKHITNGIVNKKIDAGLQLPEGWRYGRTLNKKQN